LLLNNKISTKVFFNPDPMLAHEGGSVPANAYAFFRCHDATTARKIADEQPLKRNKSMNQVTPDCCTIQTAVQSRVVRHTRELITKHVEMVHLREVPITAW
jgi:hypothetical protein